MKKTRLLQVLAILFIGWTACCLPASGQSAAKDADRPNIVWLVSEDNSKHYLRLYDETGTEMPNIEALARHGLVFEHAFSQGPVCSVARTTLISGSFAPRIGGQYHRGTVKSPMPEELEMFPYYLRTAGYFTTNNAKEDYNLIKSEDVWDESSRRATYRNRKAGQPFFHVQNFQSTHEGQLHFTTQEMKTEKTETDPASVTPFPYHPDSPTFRYTLAKYHDLNRKVDREIGEFIRQLEADGLMENTIIFYYGDHGGVLPRSKGYVYESGLHVPLVVYVPEKWQHLAPAPAGSRLKGFVQFMDFGPTVLNLAGINVPRQMDGRPFLGEGVSLEQLEAQNTAFSYADRFDEKYDLVRAVRKGKYKYIRNYQPFNMDGLYNFYRYRMLAYQNWQDLHEQGQLNEIQDQFFEARQPEALYDLESDPHETRNLAGDPFQQTILLDLRGLLQQKLKALPDLSFFPEPYFLKHGISNPVRFGLEHRKKISRYIDIADLSVLPFSRAKQEIRRALQSADALERYWGLIVCSSFGPKAAPFYRIAEKLSNQDEDALVRTRAAEFLAISGKKLAGAEIVGAFRQASSPTEANLILNSLALLKQTGKFSGVIPHEAIRPDQLSMPGGLVGWRLNYLGHGQHPRLLVLTDIGGDPDDQQSMIRLLMHSSEFELEGLIASASGTPGELREAIVRPDLIRELVTAYGKVETKLRLHNPYFAQAHTLQNLIKSGNPQRGWENVGRGHDTEGSEWIIRQADHKDGRPLNICIWGGQTDLAQALWKVKHTRSESEYRAFVSKLRIYDIADQDGIFSQMWQTFPGLWYILNKAPEGHDKREAVFRGMYLGGDEDLTSLEWLNGHVIRDHGPLGALYPQKTWTAPNPHGVMKEGDTPSWFYFLPNGLQDPIHPQYGGWGGRFQLAEAGYYIDARDHDGQKSSARSTVGRWRPDFQNDLAARMDWCIQDFDRANHHPLPVSDEGGKQLIRTFSTKPGQSLKLTAPDFMDPDGDQLSYHWSFYPEAGTYARSLSKIPEQGDNITLAIPENAGGKELHLILKISDNGSPSLSAYCRYIIQVH